MSGEKVSEKDQDKLFSAILGKTCNSQCADCNAKGPRWASIDFGVIICMNCAGAHRALGPQNTRVRSTKLDSWYLDQVQILAMIGNEISNSFFEYDQNVRRPTQYSSQQDLINFAQQKYMKRKWASSGKDPITIFKEQGQEGLNKYLQSLGQTQNVQMQNVQTQNGQTKQQPFEQQTSTVRKISTKIVDLFDCDEQDYQFEEFQTAVRKNSKHSPAKEVVNLFSLDTESEQQIQIQQNSLKTNNTNPIQQKVDLNVYNLYNQPMNSNGVNTSFAQNYANKFIQNQGVQAQLYQQNQQSNHQNYGQPPLLNYSNQGNQFQNNFQQNQAFNHYQNNQPFQYQQQFQNQQQQQNQQQFQNQLHYQNQQYQNQQQNQQQFSNQFQNQNQQQMNFNQPKKMTPSDIRSLY